MKSKKMISGLLAFTVTAYTAIPVLAASKAETVYSNLDSNGKAYKTIVSTQLTNEDKVDKLVDLSSLINIENTNGDETFSKNGNEVVWDSNGNNIYYQGESDKELPVECKITYELNGEEISAEELKGKSGNVKIKINYINNEKHTVSINGKQVTMYTPFIIVAGTKIDNTKNRNIKITNGKTVDNGESTLAVGIAMPGMQENIGISKNEIEIPEEIEISMETESFEMGNIIAVVAVKGIDEDLTSDLNSMYSQVNELVDASNQLLEGANQLKEGTNQLVEGVNQLKTGTGTAYNGSKQIKSEVEESTRKLKNDNTPAIDSKTLEAIKAQAMQSATLTTEQKETISSQAKAGATLTAEQKAAISEQAKAGATLTTEQKAAISEQAKAGATLTTEQKVAISEQAKAGATLTEEQKVAIKAEARKSAEFTEAQKEALINQAQEKYPEKLTDAEKQLIATIAQNTAYKTAEETALAVAQNIATQTAEKTAQTVAQSIATQTAEKTALTVAQSTATQTAEKTAQTVAQSTATQTAEKTALTVAQSTATQTAGETATQTATQVGNQAKQKFTNQVVSQMNTLGEALGELTNGLGDIDNGVSTLALGTNKLDNGALELATGVKTFNEQGISKINNLVNGDLRSLATRIEKMNELAKEYNNYAGIQEGMNGEVKFIMIVDSSSDNGEIKKEEAVTTYKKED